MRLRTVRTFDELESFYRMIRGEYPDYSYPRISTVHYGVFDVGEEARGWGEGERLIAGAAINSGVWDVFEAGGVTMVTFEHLIVNAQSRNRGIGTALLNFIVDSHRDLTICGRVSKKSEWKRLVSWYEQWSFRVVNQDRDEVFMEREPDDDGECFAPELREGAANRLYGEHRLGFDLKI